MSFQAKSAKGAFFMRLDFHTARARLRDDLNRPIMHARCKISKRYTRLEFIILPLAITSTYYDSLGAYKTSYFFCSCLSSFAFDFIAGVQLVVFFCHLFRLNSRTPFVFLAPRILPPFQRNSTLLHHLNVYMRLVANCI